MNNIRKNPLDIYTIPGTSFYGYHANFYSKRQLEPWYEYLGAFQNVYSSQLELACSPYFNIDPHCYRRCDLDPLYKISAASGAIEPQTKIALNMSSFMSRRAFRRLFQLWFQILYISRRRQGYWHYNNFSIYQGLWTRCTIDASL